MAQIRVLAQARIGRSHGAGPAGATRKLRKERVTTSPPAAARSAYAIITLVARDTRRVTPATGRAREGLARVGHEQDPP